MNKSVTLVAVKFLSKGSKWKYLEGASYTTKITVNFFKFGRHVTKSMERYSYTLSIIGSEANKLDGAQVSYLTC